MTAYGDTVHITYFLYASYFKEAIAYVISWTFVIVIFMYFDNIHYIMRDQWQ